MRMYAKFLDSISSYYILFLSNQLAIHGENKKIQFSRRVGEHRV